MAVNFSESKTKENLMRAFAGESQARNRYTIAAEKAKDMKMHTIAEIFLYTAEQERAHAERFYELLKEFAGETIFIDGGYPVDQQESLEELLRAAEHNEKEEYEDVYQKFGDVAKEEGLLEAASAFYQIAEIEHVHQMRFGEVAELLEKNEYFACKEESKWICTNCGYIHEGKQAPKVCPVCRHDQGYFLPYAFAEYKGEDR
ncbi:rubrerythrin family protein [Faecalicatena sp. AGMB00832]|uniref:Rubrerythrin family protein n=1 Tax=Faecalicatena faecalis TaxID=2726362 RepID=A0ABS6CYV0_9FIRM|nr:MULTISPECIES: rubrerythrin family protein [Faecalicatena]MBU3874483.1 rubrerythrin family protein [Faecalicatena faecalis]MCI6466553.1 rubrerythrin family protein [Faecalicatena sp.]MDY5617928.1 rubrerythrin family protein [Lachnospiraceae bacterium]